jgi:putative PIN family toxin of toxin-antitoxin system
MPKQKDRIVVDTNLWLSFLITKNNSALDKIFLDDFVILLYTQELIDEFITVANRSKFTRYFDNDDLQRLLLSMSRRSIFIDTTSSVDICRDPKDNFLLALSKDGKASHLITGDKDLLELKKFGKTRILTMREYLARI